MYTSKLIQASISLVVLAASAACAAASDLDRGIVWPTPVVHTEPGGWDIHDLGVLGVGAVVPLDVRAKILRQHYSPEELRNIRLTINDLARAQHAPSPHSKDFKPASHGGFYVLHGAFGYPQRNGYAGYSYMSHVRAVEDLVAKGNRVVVLMRTTGGIGGPMYGFKGNGQLMDNYESLHYEFDSDGAIASFYPWSGEDLAFYEQLGGKLEFTGDIQGGKAILAGPSVANAQPSASATSDLHAAIERESYTAEERRNIATLLAVASDHGGFDAPNRQYFAKNYANISTGASPFKTLSQINGKDKDLRLSSIKNLKRDITDVIAVDKRAFVHILSTGEQSGPLFGVASTGIPLRWNEEIYVTFDDAGKIVETMRLPVQGELYLELGGTFTFPYAQYWSCRACPFGAATMDVPGE